MMRWKVGQTPHRLGGLALAAACGTGGAYASLVACSVSQSGTGPGAGMDAGTDGISEIPDSTADAPDAETACQGVLCNGKCVTASDCRSCANASYLCGPTSTCVSDCATCADSTGKNFGLSCFACDPSHHNPVGSCQSNDTSAFCVGGDYSHAYVDGGAGSTCDCADAACPGASQVCAVFGLNNFCYECGETTRSPIDGRQCQNGKTCNASAHACQ